MQKIAMLALCAGIFANASAQTIDPFANSQLPPPAGYSGPVFALSHAYPASQTIPAMPWRAAINNGQITTANAGVYAEALKAAIGADMRVMLLDYKNWNAGQRGWYNEPWMGATSVAKQRVRMREPLRGMYVGSDELDANLFKASGLKRPITTYVLTYYDKTAAVTLNKVWGATAQEPNLTAQSTQFAEGSVIIKAAFVTAGPALWPVMQGTVSWPAYVSVNATLPKPPTAPMLTNTYLMQFDIIVKDSVAAPKTGWVFTTLVYDSRVAKTGDIWDKMVVLGAQWGNDPQASDPAIVKPVLQENWMNPNAPAYGSATLGWGGRLSGPNDGAINNIAYPVGKKPTLKYARNAQSSSCMSCHSSAQWNLASHSMPSFLLPILNSGSIQLPKPQNGTDFMLTPAPGSALWMKWFQNRKGDVPMDAGNIAGDFDMVLTFKSLPNWYASTHTPGVAHTLMNFDLQGKRLPSKEGE
ncbi:MULTISPECIES: hypothetical protein [unclassified Janthinobacterium]|uniref:Cytochrome c domain-containing protein n=1 Tax=Janthinobacterium lividum TaxID=29581 RepID=A0A1E8PL03_9BURK|nr:hypothetical protein [Janthinobacterium sp. CG_23.4]MDH6157956.1 hypothetical protein [Janthinobacterium sp. CG_23.4]OFJ46560.1 hypothetical protein BA896_021220 [Janthinobacterium lividum]